MRLNRYLKEDQIDLAFDPLAASQADDDWESEDDGEVDPSAEEEAEPTRRELWDLKVRILERLVRLLARSGKVANPRKCLTDLRNREAKATTALGDGIALPHVRTQQARGFAMGVAVVAEPGVWFDAVDEQPVRLFLPMIAPAHDDRFYLKVERALAASFAEGPELRDALLAATSPGEVIRVLTQVLD